MQGLNNFMKTNIWILTVKFRRQGIIRMRCKASITNLIKFINHYASKKAWQRNDYRLCIWYTYTQLLRNKLERDGGITTTDI